MELLLILETFILGFVLGFAVYHYFWPKKVVTVTPEGVLNKGFITKKERSKVKLSPFLE